MAAPPTPPEETFEKRRARRLAVDAALGRRVGRVSCAASRDNPLPFLALGVFVLLAPVVALLVRTLRRWSRASPTAIPPARTVPRDAWDDRLDQALEDDRAP